MNKNPKMFALVIGITVAVGVGASIAISPDTQPPKTESTENPRTIFWRHIHGLGIEPSDRSILYIATHGDFYQSVNGGPPVKVDEQRADYMAFNAPYNEGVPLYASGHPATGGNTGLIKSADGGKTWQQVATILEPPVDFHAMGVSKSNPDIIIGFDSAGRGLFKTTDAGKSWETLPVPDYITTLVIDPGDSNVVFAGFAGSQKGVSKSLDGGTSWTLLDQYKGLTVLTLSFDDAGVLYTYTSEQGLAKSSDMGKNWVKVGKPSLTIMSIAADSQNGIIYVAGYSPDGFQEVYKSSDDGNKWDLIATNKEL
ncbi:WD40/YVTN/BNR-like repeat-containing protein [Candidatus Nitrosotenuis cloacae]|uniref:WD40/YVTN/BNR-like repeat-containing protein n=1 Tax=Candidatus Nitrosotenuis cloacae TaxID=1603555 RepID=UPI002280ED24|nr:hypothetical protein [Candidatus Nitrosotenuis cloacae]